MSETLAKLRELNKRKTPQNNLYFRDWADDNAELFVALSNSATALIEIAEASKAFCQHGHPELTGNCMMDHYENVECNCGYHRLERSLSKLEAIP